MQACISTSSISAISTPRRVGQMVARQLAPVVSSLVRVDAGDARARLRLRHALSRRRSTGAERVLAFMPAGQGVIDWPRCGAPARRRRWSRRIRCRFPIPPSISSSSSMRSKCRPRPNALMAELRRVLTGGGRLIVVAPNRQGPWASTDLSPFGFGRPYSRGQLRSLFAEVGFEAETWTTALHMAPAAWRPLPRRGARARPHRPARLAGLRRRDRRRGGEAQRAGHHRCGRGRGSPRRFARRSDRPAGAIGRSPP